MRLHCLSLGALRRNKNERGNLCGAGVGGAALRVGPAHCFSHEVVAFQTEKSSVWEEVCVGQGSSLAVRPSAAVPGCALDGARLCTEGL